MSRKVRSLLSRQHKPPRPPAVRDPTTLVSAKLSGSDRDILGNILDSTKQRFFFSAGVSTVARSVTYKTGSINCPGIIQHIKLYY